MPMKTIRSYPLYTVTPKAESAIVRGHPWVYDAEILHTEGEAANGALVDVVSKKGRYLGTGVSGRTARPFGVFLSATTRRCGKKRALRSTRRGFPWRERRLPPLRSPRSQKTA